MAHVRCSKCEARRTLRRALTDYVRLPRCRGCGRKMHVHPVRRTDAHYRVDGYRAKRERGKAPTCDPSRTGCRGYSFIHRKGSGFCDHNPKLTDDDLRERYERGTWA